MKERFSPLRVAAFYAIFGAAWILLSDTALHALVHDAELESRLQTVKGWSFIVVTGGLVYWLTSQLAKDLNEKIVESARVKGEFLESEKRQRDILNNTSSVIYMKDLDGRYLLINRMFEKLFHVSHQEVIGKTDHDIFTQTIADAFCANDLMVIEAGTILEFEEIAPQDDGEHTYISVKFPICGVSGEIYAVCGISTDITERNRADAALRESEALFRAFVDHIPAMIAIRDTESHFLFVNSAWENEEGRTNEQIIGKTVHEVYLKEEADLYQTQDRTVFEMGQVVDREVEVPAIPGRRARPGPVALHTIKFPIRDAHGSITKIGAIGIDITERKRTENALRESEARFRTLVEHAPEAITMLDVDTGLYLDANPMAEALHGLPRDELIGKLGPVDLSPDIQPDGRPSSEAAPDYLSRALAGEFPRFEWMHLAPDGQEILCEVSLARLPDPHRNLVRASITDITERKAAEAASADLEAKLRQAQKMEALGQLAGGTAHEINNLMQPIITFAKLTRDEIEDPEHRHNLDRVLECGRRAKEIVADILTFARKTPSKPEVIEVRELITATIRFVRDLFTPMIEFRSEISTDTGQVLINRTEFTQVIVNLAKNAADAIDGAGTVSITAKIVDLAGHRTILRQLSDGRYFHIAVEDTGSGMTEKILERVFEPFFTTKPVGKGTGLGLSVVYGIVTGWGGSIFADSVPGEGSIFNVYIPLMPKIATSSEGLSA